MDTKHSNVGQIVSTGTLGLIGHLKGPEVFQRKWVVKALVESFQGLS